MNIVDSTPHNQEIETIEEPGFIKRNIGKAGMTIAGGLLAYGAKEWMYDLAYQGEENLTQFGLGFVGLATSGVLFIASQDVNDRNNLQPPASDQETTFSID